MKRRGVAEGVLLALLLSPLMAQGTSLARMSLEQLAGAASLVIQARCLSSQIRWEHGEIWTFTHFAVLESFKGSAPTDITVRLQGGRVGHLVSAVDGVPRFHPGEEVILFLEPTSAGDLSVTAWGEGTFRIRLEPASGRKFVTQDTASQGVFDPALRQFRANGIRRVPLEIFREQLIYALRHPSPGRQP